MAPTAHTGRSLVSRLRLRLQRRSRSHKSAAQFGKFFPATLYPITSNQYTCPLEPILTLSLTISAELPGILARRPSFRQVRPGFHSRSRFPQSLPKHQKLDLSDQQKGNGTQHTFLSVSVYSLDQNVCVSCFKIKMHTHDA